MYERILVPLDGSGLAEQVLSSVSELARVFDSEAILVGVCESGESQEREACRLYIDNKSGELKAGMKPSAAKFKTVVLVGKSADQILTFAEKNDVNLIVMTSHGRSGIAPWSLGSTARKVLHKVGVPLIIVRARETPQKSDEAGLFSRILVLLDGSERGEKPLPYIAELAKRLKPEVILFRVVEPGMQVHSVGGAEYIPFKDIDIDSMKAKAKKYLEETSSKLAGTKAIIRCEVRVGDAAKEIIKFARKADCSLIAMASHGHSGIEVWIHGSVTSKVLEASNKSVWLIPALETSG